MVYWKERTEQARYRMVNLSLMAAISVRTHPRRHIATDVYGNRAAGMPPWHPPPVFHTITQSRTSSVRSAAWQDGRCLSLRKAFAVAQRRQLFGTKDGRLGARNFHPDAPGNSTPCIRRSPGEILRPNLRLLAANSVPRRLRSTIPRAALNQTGQADKYVNSLGSCLP